MNNPTVDTELLEMLRCPACLSPFGPPAADELVCSGCALRYPVRNGVPVLLIDEAVGPEGETGPPPRTDG